MKNSPTALNKRGNKIRYRGYNFDSKKEAQFYWRFVEHCGYNYIVHPKYRLTPLTEIEGGKISSISYTPDFVIEDNGGNKKHVIDVKNSFGAYGIDQGNKLRFKLFALKYGVPVEAVVVRKNDFKVIAQGVTKTLNGKKPFVTDNFDYQWKDATNY